MTTEKMRVSASSIIRSVPDVHATAIRSRRRSTAAGAAIADECTIGKSRVEGMQPVRPVLPIRVAFGALALLWPAALAAATRIAALPQRGDAAYLLSAAVYFSAGLLCHQRPERSFYLWGTQFPVCARCAGIYAGAALGVIAELVRLKPDATSAAAPSVGLKSEATSAAAPSVGLKPDATDAVRPAATSGIRRSSALAAFARASSRTSPDSKILLAASIPALLTLVAEWTTGVTPANWIRALSGLVLGAAAAIVVMRAGAAPRREVH